MRLLQTIESLDPAFGGTVEAVLQFTRAFEQLGVSADIATLDAPSQVWETGLPEGRVHRLGPPRTFYRYCPALGPWLQANLDQYDGVIVHGLWRHHNAGVWRALARQPRPCYVVVHSMLNPWFNTTGRLKHLRKILYWRAVEHRTLRDATAVIYTSEEERRLAGQSFRPYACREVVLPLGTSDPALVSPDEFFAAYPDLRGKRIVMFLGRLHPMKGCDLLLRAWRQIRGEFPETHLVMAGPDSAGWRAELEKLASAAVTFTGPLYGSMKWSALAAADLFALPSHCEAFPYAVLEALAYRLPVLLTDQVNLVGYLTKADCALAGRDTEEATRDSLRRWLESPAERQAAMGRNARACFLENFEVSRAAARFIDFLRADAGGGKSIHDPL